MTENEQAGRRRFCTAPMMRYSHAAARRLWHCLCPPALLYTEMFFCEAIIRTPRPRLLQILQLTNAPTALQLGGADARRLAHAAQIGEECGAAEVNLNCGCPSPRARCGNFGAVLMKTPSAVGAAVAALKKSLSIPVTVKCRIAVDDMDADGDLDVFARTVRDSGADALVLHARRAFLDGLNPAQNRSRPPLDYARARRLKESLGDFPLVVNGGVADVEEARRHLRVFDGVMPGRAIVRRPYFLAEAAAAIFGVRPPRPKRGVAADAGCGGGKPARVGENRGIAGGAFSWLRGGVAFSPLLVAPRRRRHSPPSRRLLLIGFGKFLGTALHCILKFFIGRRIKFSLERFVLERFFLG